MENSEVDTNEHYTKIRILVLHNKYICYVSKNIVTIFDTISRFDYLFDEHTQPITFIASNPNINFVATSQIDGTIFIWNFMNLIPIKTVASSVYRKLQALSSVITMDFSADGVYLLVFNSSNSIMIFNWYLSNTLAKVDCSHAYSEYGIRFNPFAYSLCNNIPNELICADSTFEGCCYTFVSCNNSVIKFWTFTGTYTYINSEGFEDLLKSESYEVIGEEGIFPNTKSVERPSFSCFEFVEYDSVKKISRIFALTESSTLYIWQQQQKNYTSVSDSNYTSWTSQGQLLAIIVGIYETSISSMCYFRISESASILISSSECGDIVTVWDINSSYDSKLELALAFNASISLSTIFVAQCEVFVKSINVLNHKCLIESSNGELVLLPFEYFRVNDKELIEILNLKSK